MIVALAKVTLPQEKLLFKGSTVIPQLFLFHVCFKALSFLLYKHAHDGHTCFLLMVLLQLRKKYGKDLGEVKTGIFNLETYEKTKNLSYTHMKCILTS